MTGLAAVLAGLSPLPDFAASAAGAADKANANFELPGPKIIVDVTRGDKTLPISRVPSLQPGDRISLHLPRSSDADDQARDFLVVAAFLRGAVNPPPDKWIGTAQGWKKKTRDNTLDLTVPEGAHQMVVLIVPRTQGAQGVLEDAVQGKPGEFVRAGGELYEASLDHSRLETFMASIRAQGDRNPEALRKVAPVLATSLGMKLQKDCLDKVLDEQASCLVEGRSSLVLSDVHTSSLADTLAGTPTDLALQVSATPQAGSGSYSAYIGVARDIARMFGAFNNPQFGYLPALTLWRKDELSLLLNTAPSFAKPKSVMVVGMPAVEADVPPQLRASDPAPICAAQGSVVLPVEGAPLVYSTNFAHEMALRVTAADGKSVDVPVAARADRGGYVFEAGAVPASFTGNLRAHLHGRWGFAPFEGPDFVLQRPGAGDWQSVGDDGALVLGRDSTAVLAGDAPACVTSITLAPTDRSLGKGAPRPLEWKVEDSERLAVTVPLKDAQSGPVHLAMRLQGVDKPVELTLETRVEASRVDSLELHAGDGRAQLTGQRLDQVRRITLDDLPLVPEGLARSDGHDVLDLNVDATRLPPAGTALTARIALTDGRTITLPVTIAPPRPSAHLLSRSVRMPEPAQGSLSLGLGGEDLLPADGELVFSLEGEGGQPFSSDVAVEIGANGPQPLARLTFGKGLMPSSADVLVGRLDAGTLPQGSFGPLRFRLVENGVAGAWQPLATLVRLPRIEHFTCKRGAGCTISGRNLFLVSALGADPQLAEAQPVPAGFTGNELKATASDEGTVYLRLRDDPAAVATLSKP